MHSTEFGHAPVAPTTRWELPRMMDMEVLNELPGKLRDGDDLAWLQTQYDTGALADVGAQVTPVEWATVGTALHAGDLETVRTVLKDAQIEGVGPVVVAKRNN